MLSIFPFQFSMCKCMDHFVAIPERALSVFSTPVMVAQELCTEKGACSESREISGIVHKVRHQDMLDNRVVLIYTYIHIFRSWRQRACATISGKQFLLCLLGTLHFSPIAVDVQKFTRKNCPEGLRTRDLTSCQVNFLL